MRKKVLKSKNEIFEVSNKTIYRMIKKEQNLNSLGILKSTYFLKTTDDYRRFGNLAL